MREAEALTGAQVPTKSAREEVVLNLDTRRCFDLIL